MKWWAESYPSAIPFKKITYHLITFQFKYAMVEMLKYVKVNLMII